MTRRIQRKMFNAAFTVAGVLALAGCAKPDTSGPANAQGWTPGNQRFWYETSQGSRLVPAAWWAALEQPGSTAPFSDQTYLATFGYIPSAPDRLEKRQENLPVGFALDRQPDDAFIHSKLQWYKGQPTDKRAEPWVGMNCAACHSAEITYKGQAFRVDGGPGMGDYQSFINALDMALHQTLEQADRWDRFAAKVLTGKDTPENRAMLKKELGVLVTWQDKVADVNGDRPDGVLRYGYARVDAFGHIYNKVALFNQADPQPGNPSDAPVSYPFLWDITLQERVQWNGAVQNQRLKIGAGSIDYGALGRNAGEVIGVFGEVVIPKWGEKPHDGKIRSYKSSLQIDALDRLEQVLTTLKSPVWPDAFGKLDTTLVSQGEAVFDRLKCGDCHVEKEDWVKGQPIERMTTLKAMNDHGNLTDIWMACNAVTYQTATGNLVGAKMNIVKGPEMAANDLVFNQLSFTVKTALVGKARDIVDRIAQIFFGIEKPPVLAIEDGDTFEEAKRKRGEQCVSGAGMPPEVMKFLAYKGRPLDGIWATAPYLHNGSVPTLYHLLLAPKDRPKSFYIGSHEYDPKFAGYVWQTPPSVPHSKFETVDAGDNPIPGNSNAGHDYGVGGLSEPDRRALLEYLKSL